MVNIFVLLIQLGKHLFILELGIQKLHDVVKMRVKALEDINGDSPQEVEIKLIEK